jgi:hypothetical protein
LGAGFSERLDFLGGWNFGIFANGQIAGLSVVLPCSMAAFPYRCLTTGRNVQGWSADDVSEDEGETYEAVTCLACAQQHLVNRSTGWVLGADDQ